MELSPNMYQFFEDQPFPEPLPYDEELKKIEMKFKEKRLDLVILVNRINRLIVKRPNDSIVLGNIYPGKKTIVMRRMVPDLTHNFVLISFSDIGGKLEDVQNVLPGTSRSFAREDVKETEIWRDLNKRLDEGCEDHIIDEGEVRPASERRMHMLT